MQYLSFTILFIFCFFLSFSQVAPSCNSWLQTPSTPSYITLGDLDITGNKLTVEATFNRSSVFDNTLNFGKLVSKHTDVTNVNYSLLPVQCEITTDVTGYVATPQVCLPDLDKTYHVAMVYDGATLKFYRDGFLLTSTSCTGNLITNNLLTTIGQIADPVYPNLTQFKGYINEVRIWNTVRTQSQLRTYMNTSLPNPTTQAGLLAYYTFNTLLNKQGNLSWNGVLGGSASINATNPDCTFIADSCSKVIDQTLIINDYTPVIAFNPCNNSLIVEDAAKYNPGDTVLIIQMKGAVIDSSNTSNFGQVTNYRNAGNYEFNYVKQKTGNVIELKNVITKKYDVPAGKVQLIRVPYYITADINTTLTCLPWDGSKGGVFAINVRDNLNLNADINVSGKGFSGGNSKNPHTTITYCFNDQYYYQKGDQSAAEKGEGISAISDNIAWGKGSPANGGGGGNGHNSGGGGGANGGSGGFGGYQLDVCGTSPFDNRGIGGKSLIYNNASNKIYMGGGGGSGHTDNGGGADMPGGNGGGIIIINSPVINPNGFQIKANGNDAYECNLNPIELCHDGSGGGGAGGTILIQTTNVSSSGNINVSGGKGGDLVIYNGVGATKIGPGGGGGAGIVWFSTPALPVNFVINKAGGQNGVILQNNNDPWGTTKGQDGLNLFNLKMPVDALFFKKNIDSVKINNSATSCNSFNFKGQGYTNVSPIINWQWDFGDGSSGNTQNTFHTYATSGNYLVKLVGIDVNGCKDSNTTQIFVSGSNIDFYYKQEVCNPLSVQFFSTNISATIPEWNFGDGSPVSSSESPVHVFTKPGNYIVSLNLKNGCGNFISKSISINYIKDNIILTQDTSICFGNTKQLVSSPSLNFCWTPVTFLDNPLSANPITSAPQKITYYLTAQVTGDNVITNGNFNNGNNSFTSEYSYANPNITEGEYFVGSTPESWNSALSSCRDHTTGNGNMLLVNGSPVPDINVWKQTVTVTPNTNYAFSTWVQALWPPNPAQLKFSINGGDIGNLITASLPTCTWTQFFSTWNSGNNILATISIVNKNTEIQGNDFALDDISFAPVVTKRDSVIINVNKPAIKSNKDTTVCVNSQVQLNTSGASSYTWTPVSGLSSSKIPNPTAIVNSTTNYIVTGTNSSGCVAKDTVVITVLPKPLITKTTDTAICTNASIRIFANGGVSYVWFPSSSLSNPNIANPVAMPSATTVYHVKISDANSCNYSDSVKVGIKPLPVFTVSPDQTVCSKNSKQLSASGGNSYLWQPATYLNNPSIQNPIASPVSTTIFNVKIKNNTCNDSVLLSTTLTVAPAPQVNASKANDIDCSTISSQLNASGALNYIWSPPSDLNNGIVANPIASPKINTLYTVKGTDINGCSGTDTITVQVGLNADLFYAMPNSFTPNGDNLNDCYGLKYWGVVEQLDFSIYNRFGEKVFYTSNPSVCWDGKYKGKLQDANAFVYMISAKTACGKIDKKGYFLLIK